MSQNGQTHFRNLAALASVSGYFGTLCIKELKFFGVKIVSTLCRE